MDLFNEYLETWTWKEVSTRFVEKFLGGAPNSFFFWNCFRVLFPEEYFGHTGKIIEQFFT